MFKFLVVLLLYCVVPTSTMYAQDTLPKISVKDRFGKIIISWKNTYGAKISNINIQRSADSIKKFTTIGTVLNPINRENGFVDSKAPTGKIFYRVFVAFEGGEYIFSHSYRPVVDSTKDPEVEIEKKETVDEKQESNVEKKETDVEKKEIVKPIPRPVFIPSKFVFTGKDNNVIINLTDAASQKFSIKFFEENGSPLFELHTIKEPYLILDKVNFLHAGWFQYHLFNNDILLEKFKFFIPRDSKIINNGKELKN
jgi:hypothetical protein